MCINTEAAVAKSTHNNDRCERDDTSHSVVITSQRTNSIPREVSELISEVTW